MLHLKDCFEFDVCPGALLSKVSRPTGASARSPLVGSKFEVEKALSRFGKHPSCDLFLPNDHHIETWGHSD